MKKTKIVITLGPATEDKNSITKLIKLGVDVIRLNFSHGTHAQHKKNVELIREVSRELDKEVAILQDISGPKIRIGEIDGELELKRGDILKLSKVDSVDRNTLSISYPEILDLVSVGEEIYFADGTIISVIKDKSTDTISLEILNDGKLTSKKGVNFPDTKLNISAITPKDKKDLIFGTTLGFDIVALSFVHNKEDILEAREILKQYNSTPLIISKIETREALSNLNKILDSSDGAMVARGDLGAEFGVIAVPRIQKKIIAKANRRNIPVITATQMLSSMIKSPFPTRAEVSDIANAIYDGTDAVMLSDETTVGEFPIKAVKVLKESIIDAEIEYPYDADLIPSECGDDSIAYSAVKLSKHLKGIDALIAFTTSGFSAKSLAKFRPKKKIYAVTHSIETFRKLKLIWGVEPISVVQSKTPAKLIYSFIKDVKPKGFITKNCNFIVTMGDIAGKKGATNLIRVLDKYAIKKIEEKFKD